MPKFKKFLVGAIAVLGTALLAGCSNSAKKQANSGTPKSLNVQFVPSVSANTLETKAKPLEKMLSKRLGIPVHVSVSTSGNALVEAMKSKKVDVGFLPGDDYVQAHKQHAADVLLQSERFGLTRPDGNWTKKLVHTFHSEILVRKDSGIKSWKDLKGKKISIQSPTSTSGYIFPVAELKEKGLDVPRSCKLVTTTGHDQAVLNVLNKDTDAAFVFEDARNNVIKDNPKIKSQVVPIYYTTEIPNDTISVIPSLSKSFREKLANAFIAIGKSKEGKKVIEQVYSHEGYVKAKDSDYDTVRKYEKIAESIKK